MTLKTNISMIEEMIKDEILKTTNTVDNVTSSQNFKKVKRTLELCVKVLKSATTSIDWSFKISESITSLVQSMKHVCGQSFIDIY